MRNWPTPAASRGGYNQSDSPGAKIRPSIRTLAVTNQWPTPQARDHRSGETASDYGNSRPLNEAATWWATPAAHERAQDPRQVDHGAQLANQAAMWATPNTGESRSGHGRRGSPRDPSDPRQSARDLEVQAARCSHPGPRTAEDGLPLSLQTRRLNPRFVEWLMGFPIGWTAFDALGTERSHWKALMQSSLSPLGPAAAGSGDRIAHLPARVPGGELEV